MYKTLRTKNQIFLETEYELLVHLAEMETIHSSFFYKHNSYKLNKHTTES